MPYAKSSKPIHCVQYENYHKPSSVFPSSTLGVQFSEWTTAEPSTEPPVTRMSGKDNPWLYTLDPILLTIIVMSSLGVLLGAVCAGLLLYCTCSYGGLTSRSSTTLENYNFELYDGIKHKVKLNQQRCCTEA
ncbi:neuropilin-2a isoform X1 [Tachysurus ichikawai]